MSTASARSAPRSTRPSPPSARPAPSSPSSAPRCHAPSATDSSPYEHVDPPIEDVARRIGGYVAELVPDGATLQMGIGSIPAAVGEALRDKHDLGYTELFTDVVLDLVEAGALTGTAKLRVRKRL